MDKPKGTKESKLEVLASIEVDFVDFLGKALDLKGNPLTDSGGNPIVVYGFNRTGTPIDDVKNSDVRQYFQDLGYSIETVRVGVRGNRYDVLGKAHSG